MTVLAIVFAVWAVWLKVPGRPRSAPRGQMGLPAWLRVNEGAMRPRMRLVVGGAAGLGVALVVESFSTVLALVLGGLVCAGVAVFLGWIEPASAQRARDQRIREMPHTLELLAACLSSGLPLRRAMRVVANALAFDREGDFRPAAVTSGGPAGDGDESSGSPAADPSTSPIANDLALLVGLVDIGMGERQAWQRLADRPEWHAAARDIARAAEAGTGLRRVLERHAQQARQLAHARRRERARTLGVRSVLPLMVCFLPAFVFVGIVPTIGSFVVDALQGR